MTPHAINIIDGPTLPPSGRTIRLKMETAPAGEVDGIPLTRTVYGKAEGLPEVEPGTYYVVSSMVKAVYPERRDFLVPAEMVRDKDGRVVGCRSLGL